MIRRPPRSTLSSSSAASDVYKRQRQTYADNFRHTQFQKIRTWSGGNDGDTTTVRVSNNPRMRACRGPFSPVAAPALVIRVFSTRLHARQPAQLLVVQPSARGSLPRKCLGPSRHNSATLCMRVASTTSTFRPDACPYLII